MPKQLGDFGAGWQRGLMSTAMPPVDDGARERLAKIVKFFDTRCEGCTTHYCPDCTFRFEKMILEAAEYLAELPNG
jgi:hypothetical protein